MNHRLLAPALAAAAVALLQAPALAKLPAPGDEAKAKAAEAAAKTAHGNKVANYQLCKSMDRVAAGYYAQAKKEARSVKPAVATDACADPGAFVYPQPATVAAAAPAAAPALAAKPAPAPGPAVAAKPAAAAAPAAPPAPKK
jgi:hypothetical protein